MGKTLFLVLGLMAVVPAWAASAVEKANSFTNISGRIAASGEAVFQGGIKNGTREIRASLDCKRSDGSVITLVFYWSEGVSCSKAKPGAFEKICNGWGGGTGAATAPGTVAVPGACRDLQ